jgi:1-phosphofructokinase
MKIVTVTFNPAVDKYLYLDSFIPGCLNRARTVKVYPSGKGINVSLALLKLEMKSEIVALVGGRSGAYIKESVEAAGLTGEFFEVSGETRTNIKLLETENRRTTELNEPGPSVHPQCVSKVVERILEMAREVDCVVVSGSILHGFGLEAYGELIRGIRTCGAKAVVDAEGETLRVGISAKPFLVKPNRYEAEELLNYRLVSRADFQRAVRDILGMGVETAIISDGPEGAIFAQQGQILWASCPAVRGVESPFGCGDALVAGFLASLARGESFVQAARFALATATATAITEGTSFPVKNEVDAMTERIVVEML